MAFEPDPDHVPWPHEEGLRTYLQAKLDQVAAAIDAKDADGVVDVLEDLGRDGYPELAQAVLQALVAAGLQRYYLLAILGLQQPKGDQP